MFYLYRHTLQVGEICVDMFLGLYTCIRYVTNAHLYSYTIHAHINIIMYVLYSTCSICIGIDHKYNIFCL